MTEETSLPQDLAAAEEPIDRVIQIADLHFWHVVLNPFRLLSKRAIGNFNVWLNRRHEFIMDRAKDFADTVIATGIRSVIFTGDFTSTANREEFAMAGAFVEGLHAQGLDIQLLPGNHDVYTFRSLKMKRFEQTFEDYVPEEGYPALVHLPGGTPVILAPTVTPNYLSSRGRITPAEVEKVAELLEQCPSMAIVAAHYPVLERTYSYAQDPSHRLRNAQVLRQALGESGRRILYVCGHTHRFSYVRDAQYENLSHLSTGAFFRKDAGSSITGEFAEIHVARAGFSVFRHIHEEQWRRDAVEIRPMIRD